MKVFDYQKLCGLLKAIFDDVVASEVKRQDCLVVTNENRCGIYGLDPNEGVNNKRKIWDEFGEMTIKEKDPG